MSVDASGLIEKLRGDFSTDLARRLGDEFVNEARINAPRETGFLEQSVRADAPRQSGDSVTVTVTCTAPYGRWQDEGTGVYIGQGRIYPTHAKALSFYWKKAGGFVTFASVAGTPPTHWWENTVRAWPDIVSVVA